MIEEIRGQSENNRYGHGIPGQQIALWGYKLTFTHPITKETMTFYDVPHGGILTVYKDLLDIGGEGYRTHEEQ